MMPGRCNYSVIVILKLEHASEMSRRLGEAGHCSCNVLVADKLSGEHMPLGHELISQGWVGPGGEWGMPRSNLWVYVHVCYHNTTIPPALPQWWCGWVSALLLSITHLGYNCLTELPTGHRGFTMHKCHKNTVGHNSHYNADCISCWT